MADDLGNLEIRLKAITDRVLERGTIAIRQAALIADRLLVFGTPVDTGRARGGWIVNLNAPLLSVSDLNRLDKEGGTGAGARVTLAQHQSVIGNFFFGQTIFISNFVPYIGALNEGTSAQAPAGFVQDAISQSVAFLRRFKFTS